MKMPLATFLPEGAQNNPSTLLYLGRFEGFFGGVKVLKKPRSPFGENAC